MAYAGCLRLRDECLNEEPFDTFADARQMLALWRDDYNNVRPHSSLGNKTPAEARRALELFEGTVLDWFTRRVLSWRISIALEADFCIEAVAGALARHGKPGIFNTDQGSQVTSTDFIKVLAAQKIRISMDGKGAWRDNIFVDRRWQTIKYEEVYLRASASFSEARDLIARYLGFYNNRRPHSSLNGKAPDQAYFNPLTLVSAAI